jgi:hypothetical protein
MIDEPAVKSPCISICVLDEQDICAGCYRTGLEITDWVMYSDDEKRAVLTLCREREQAANAHLKS